MRLLLTGTRGFTGQHLAALAARQGHEVLALDHDLRDADGLREHMASLDFTHVAHLAAISSPAHRDRQALYETNLFGTLNLLDAMLSSGRCPARILLTSSANVYGNSPHSPIGEACAPAPVNHYAMSKLAMEHMARTYQDRLPIFFTRPFNYIGPGQSPNFIMPKLVDHFRRRADSIELGNLDVERELNDVRLVAEVYLRLLRQADAGEIYNIGTGKAHRLSEIIERLTSLTGHRPTIRVNPAFVRDNEIPRLTADPTKLVATVGDLPDYPLDDTLRWMLGTMT